MIDAPDLDRLRLALEKLVRNIMRRVDYLALYPAEVLADHGNNTWDLKPYDPRLPAAVKVKLAGGIPGVKVQVGKGAQVLLGFAGGNPKAPRVYLWEAASVEALTLTATKVVIDSSTVLIDAEVLLGGEGGAPVARVGDPVVAGGLAGMIQGPGSSKVKAV